ncbi:uncharacterized protein BDZ83DRAFT_612511 [Colletotrichum acutatum]|uniref:Uncharacterized protein n=1 Tax=Glomerella acutata TaxID=27357 RepID=A0AAD8XHN1_GLOAC|nr:uncharacterized protein BDZ83DRAFT_612511 [Colletotrichum acutatum]KAK1727617.1 hypothetical protein BDZ83DRAFT_612511 [Colletotrichum acutatum]
MNCSCTSLIDYWDLSHGFYYHTELKSSFAMPVLYRSGLQLKRGKEHRCQNPNILSINFQSLTTPIAFNPSKPVSKSSTHVDTSSLTHPSAPEVPPNPPKSPATRPSEDPQHRGPPST